MLIPYPGYRVRAAALVLVAATLLSPQTSDAQRTVGVSQGALAGFRHWPHHLDELAGGGSLSNNTQSFVQGYWAARSRFQATHPNSTAGELDYGRRLLAREFT